MIFQDPRAQINPVRRIGDFMVEAVVAHDAMTRRDADARAVELLDAVGITHAKDRLRQYPHELSGGMLQRVMIASALMGSPRLLLADEPTTALDVTTQAGVMGIIDQLRREHGLAMIFITHDLELAAAVCDRTAVMYAGEIVEVSISREMDTNPQHPYTAALVQARPRVDVTLERLGAIPGQPMPALAAPRSSCAFAERCRFAAEPCTTSPPPVVALGSALSRCHRAHELGGLLHESSNG
jgi:oligopeptide/dipeptide ABC transporter ATP-binding protein